MKNIFISGLILGLLYFVSVGAVYEPGGGGGGMTGGTSFTIQTVDIGTWDMDAATTTTTTTGISAAVNKVRVIDIWILNDAEDTVYNLTTMQGSPQEISGSISDVTDPGDVTLDVTFDRRSSGFFDASSDFNDGSMNRGFITIITEN